jgi:glucan-binding YG repeat protein
MGKLPYYEFAIQVEMLPDEEEKQRVEEMLAYSIQAGTLKSEDVFAVRRLLKEDVDKAELVLASREKKRIKEAQEQAQMQSQANAEAQAYAAQVAEQAKQQTIQLEGEIKAMLLDKEWNYRIQIAQLEGDQDRLTEVVKGDVKEELIKTAAEMEVAATDGGAVDEAKGKSNNKGYDIKRDSIPKEAGRVEERIQAGSKLYDSSLFF